MCRIHIVRRFTGDASLRIPNLLFFWVFLAFAGLLVTSCGMNQTTPGVGFSTPENDLSPTATRTKPAVTSPTATAIVPTSTATATATPSTTPTSENTRDIFQFCSPLGRETLQSIFEIVSDPYAPPTAGSLEARHHGVDFSHYTRDGFSTIEGESVHIVLQGKVASVVDDRLPYGNMMIVESPLSTFPPAIQDQLNADASQSIYMLYAHMMEAPDIEIGEMVSCGQEIGAVGKTGYNIVNPHLHLEVRLGKPGAVFESMAFYTTTASGIEMENYNQWRTSGEFVHMDPMRLFELYIDWISE